jgi:hypothetical protein
MLLTAALFFPFAAHPHVFAQPMWTHVVNGTFVAAVAVTTVLVGRRLSVWANVGLFFGITVFASLTTHFALHLLGFPFQGDSP